MEASYRRLRADSIGVVLTRSILTFVDSSRDRGECTMKNSAEQPDLAASDAIIGDRRQVRAASRQDLVEQ